MTLFSLSSVFISRNSYSSAMVSGLESKLRLLPRLVPRSCLFVVLWSSFIIFMSVGVRIIYELEKNSRLIHVKTVMVITKAYFGRWYVSRYRRIDVYTTLSIGCSWKAFIWCGRVQWTILIWIEILFISIVNHEKLIEYRRVLLQSMKAWERKTNRLAFHLSKDAEHVLHQKIAPDSLELAKYSFFKQF